MPRITITVDEELLVRLREIARREGVSLAEVVRQGLRRRAEPPRPPGFIGIAESTGPRDTARRSADLRAEPRSWRS